MCDFATAVEKTVRVELIVVPIAHGFTFVVDTERVRGRGTRKVDGGHVRRMRVDPGGWRRAECPTRRA